MDDAPALSMVKVPCDPAQITGSHAVFRVRFPAAQSARSPRVARYSPTASRTWEAVPPAGGALGALGESAAAVVPAATAARPGAARPGSARPPGAHDAGSVAGLPDSAVARRRAPVVWSGRSTPGDPGATGLLQAVWSTRPGTDGRVGEGHGPAGDGHGWTRHGAVVPDDANATQVIPRVDAGTGATTRIPAIGVPRGPADDDTHPLPRVPGATDPHEPRPRAGRSTAGHPHDGWYDDGYGSAPHGGYDDPYDRGYGTADAAYGPDAGNEGDERHARSGTAGVRRRGTDAVRHAYYPGRRMNLGVVLLPLRIFLGLLCAYAGMRKLCDPDYFDGGERGTLVRSLRALHPWQLAEPLRDAALQHPVGAGLTVAFLQVVVGVLTVLGLWQRVAAVVGGLLSAALILTVSWRNVPGFGAPDIIYLAAWSPLVIAGAPVYSVDGRLSSEAWRTLGPRAELWELRRRVLRRGAFVAGLATGLTFLVGALLGGAVRDADRLGVPGHGGAPRNALPGLPLPDEPGARHSGSSSPSASPSAPGSTSASPTESTTPGLAQESATTGAEQPSQTQGMGTGSGNRLPPDPGAPAASAGPSSSGGSGMSATGGTGGAGGTRGAGGDSGSLMGGLLG